MTSQEDTTLAYGREVDLVKHLEQFLSIGNPFPNLSFASEFDYVDGRVDVVALSEDGDLFSFEAKLSRWRTAICQAYRATSFSHYSFVVLPAETVCPAVKRQHEFERLGVGLCSVAPEGLVILIPASRRMPFQPWITDTAMRYIEVYGKPCLPRSSQLQLSSHKVET